jgi:hypothetical protein
MHMVIVDTVIDDDMILVCGKGGTICYAARRLLPISLADIHRANDKETGRRHYSSLL